MRLCPHRGQAGALGLGDLLALCLLGGALADVRDLVAGLCAWRTSSGAVLWAARWACTRARPASRTAPATLRAKFGWMGCSATVSPDTRTAGRLVATRSAALPSLPASAAR